MRPAPATLRPTTSAQPFFYEGSELLALADAHNYYRWIAALCAPHLYAESGYRSLMYPLSSAPDTFFVEARRAGARYVVADASTLANLYLFPALRAHPSRFCTLPDFQRIRASLMRIEPEGAERMSAPDTAVIKPC